MSITGASFTFGAPTVRGPNAADFSIDSSVTTCTGTKSAGSSCTVRLRYTAPRVAPIASSATLNVNDAGGNPRLTVPLTGTSK